MAGPIVVSIIGDNKKLMSSVDGSTSKLGKLGGVAGKVGKVAAIGLAAAGAAAVVVGAKLITAGEAAGTSNARIEQIAKSMGIFGKEADNVSGRLVKLANEQAKATGIDQNSIKMTQAKLLTFKELAGSADKVGGNFDRATTAALDLASSGFGSAESNAAQLGKALNDPVKGLTALAKSGVTFTEQEKVRIKTLAESNRMGEAQNMVLGAIEKQVGGTSVATANGTDRMKVAFSQLMEGAGLKLVPFVDKFANVLIDRLLPGVEQMIPVVATFASGLGDTLGPIVGALVAGLTAAVPTLQSVGTGALQLGTAFTTNVLPVIQSVAGYIVSTFGPVLSSVAGVVTGVVVPAFRAVATFVTGTLLPKVTAIVTAVGSNLRPVFDQIASTITGQVVPAVQKGAKQFQEMWPQIQKVVGFLVDAGGAFFKVSSTILGAVLPPVIKFAGFLIANLIPAIVGTIGIVVKIASAFIDLGARIVDGAQQIGRFAVTVNEKIGEAVAFIRDVPSKIKGIFSNAGELLKGIGGDIVQGLVNGITGAYDKVLSAAQGLIDKIPAPIRKAMGIASPSKVMKQIGGFIVDGLVQGVGEGAPAISAKMGELATKLTASWEKLGKGKKPKSGAVDAILQSVSGQVTKLRGLAAQYAATARTLDSARQLAAGVTGSAVSFAGIGGLGIRESTDADGNTVTTGPTAATIAEDLAAKLSALRNFTTNVDALRTAGLNQTSVDQIIADGVEKGSLTASALVAGGPEALAAVNGLQGQITGAAGQLGQVAAVNMFGTGQQAAAGFTAGLESSLEELGAVAKKIAKKLTKAIKKELGIKSPSRVAMGLARQFTDGIVIQTNRDGRRVQLAGRNAAGALVSGFDRPQLAADAVASSVRSGGAPMRLTLTAEQLDALTRGKALQADLDAWRSVGGREAA